MTEQARHAVAADVDAITAMASARRTQYAEYQPAFWRPASDAEQLHRPHLARLIDNQDVITLVSEDSALFTGYLLRSAIEHATERGAVQVVVEGQAPVKHL